MERIARDLGYETRRLLTEKATYGAVTRHFEEAAETLQSGDAFMVTFAGHGGRIYDFGGEEADGVDETWCLFDEQWIDDDIWEALSRFKKDVLIYVVTDCCHSATNVRAPLYNILHSSPLGPSGPMPQFRVMPSEVARRVYAQNEHRYRKRHEAREAAGGRAEANARRERLDAVVHHLAACQDFEYAMDGPANGLFTGAFLKAWNGPIPSPEKKFSGNWKSLRIKVKDWISKDNPTALQTPNYAAYSITGSPHSGVKPLRIPK